MSTSNKIFDPLRKKFVALTPEEGVRQWFIKVLHDQFGYPYHIMRSEVAFNFGQEVFSMAAGSSRKVYRADIVIYDRAAKPLVTVECKRPEVPLTEAVAQQALRYNSVLDTRWIVLTNGTNTILFHREGNSFVPTAEFPKYEEI